MRIYIPKHGLTSDTDVPFFFQFVKYFDQKIDLKKSKLIKDK